MIDRTIVETEEQRAERHRMRMRAMADAVFSAHAQIVQHANFIATQLEKNGTDQAFQARIDELGVAEPIKRTAGYFGR